MAFQHSRIPKTGLCVNRDVDETIVVEFNGELLAIDVCEVKFGRRVKIRVRGSRKFRVDRSEVFDKREAAERTTRDAQTAA